jgi:hypothetical protein
MSSDPNKKSARTFQCRDVLWETFEQMARELECSVDYLINEAMKQYARQRSYGSRTPFPGGSGRGASENPGQYDRSERGDRAFGSQPPGSMGMRDSMGGGGGSPGSIAPTPPVPPPPQMRNAAPLGAPSSRLPPPPMRPGSGIGGSTLPLPPPRGGGMGGGMARGMPAPPGRSNMPPAARSVPPPLPRQQTPVPAAPLGSNGGYVQSHGAALSVIYQGEKLPVTKDRFVIGRGKQSSDLTLKDPNVSRQHAMIEFQNGVYFMVDMGSTNGVEYNGQRIARKQIAEGDVFKICDHDLRFTYR